MSTSNTSTVRDQNIVIFQLPYGPPFRLSALKYVCFLVCGIANLWPWNCFLSASEYFQDSFSSKPVLANTYSSSMMTISTLASASFNLYLSQKQKGADYRFRLNVGNMLQAAVFLLLTISTFIKNKPAVLYFVYVMISVFVSSCATSFAQVGVLALVNLEGPIYANANVVGNAVAGVLPSISLIVSIFLSKTQSDRDREVFNYFFTSLCIEFLALSLIWITYRYKAKAGQFQMLSSDTTLELDDESTLEPEEEHVSFRELWHILKYVQIAIFLTLSLTLTFPVFASNVLSDKIDKKYFVPIAFLLWNLGDLGGRVITASPWFVLEDQRKMIIYAALRVLFIPLFMMCNLQGRGGVFGDFIYLLLQLLFGLSNGQLFSSAFMTMGVLLTSDKEKKAAGGFTAFLINVALLFGSVVSYIFVYLVSA
ncbi:hypothetical protein KL938_004457 [Ogataea parapolymorpha]|nr:hypothetical protein KL938_004457 [Ogataea parapolymorpha]